MRKRKLIKVSMQFQFLRIVLMAILLPSVLLIGCFYLFIHLMLRQDILATGLGHSILNNQVLVILIFLFSGYILITVGLIAWSLIISNKMAGPIYRLENDLTKFLDGEKSIKFSFREGDDLFYLSNLLNRLIEKIQDLERSGQG